ncbi:restriction endonuclease [Oceanobacillus manasiensis]|uniref:restriction endonuclease n=1 Tax=Oceanobacillus manasiensis TaxID=586413 RepID=UPI0005AB0EA0|nr:restriction endonuclease [Oceanobacillus manasiensis]
MVEFFEGFLQGLQLLWSILTAEPILLVSFLVFFGGSLAVGLTVRVIREKKLRRSGMLEVDKMSGRMFEEFLHTLFKSKGYTVKLTPARGDYGADLLLTGKGNKVAVQAKRYKKNVGVKAVQEVVSARSYYSVDECWVVTNSFYTEQAKKLARSNHVRLVDRKELMDWMLAEVKGAS